MVLFLSGPHVLVPQLHLYPTSGAEAFDIYIYVTIIITFLLLFLEIEEPKAAAPKSKIRVDTSAPPNDHVGDMNPRLMKSRRPRRKRARFPQKLQ